MGIRSLYLALMLLFTWSFVFPLARATEVAESGELTELEKRLVEIHLHEISELGFPLTDILGIYDSIDDLDTLRDSLHGLIGNKLSRLPGDREIAQRVEQLCSMLKIFKKRAYVLSTDPKEFATLGYSRQRMKTPVAMPNYEKIFALTHDNWLKVQQEQKNVRSFAAKLRDKASKALFGANSAARAWDDFYTQIYLALSQEALLKNLPSQSKRNEAGSPEDLQIKRSYLINLLAGLKNPRQPYCLTEGICTTVKPVFPLDGLASCYLFELRVKILLLSYNLSSRPEDEKLLILGHLLHAGRHCNDAKKTAISSLFKRFLPEAEQRIEASLYRKGKGSMAYKVAVIAAREKGIKLERIIGATIDNLIIADYARIPNIRNQISSQELARERISAEHATWDFYAESLGLPLKNGGYPSYAITLFELFDSPGNYSPTHLFNVVNAEMGSEILEGALGFLSYLFPSPEAVILGYLQEWKFLSRKVMNESKISFIDDDL